MPRFSGKQYKGASKALKAIKREEAEKRNALTPPERRSGVSTADRDNRK